MDLLVGTFDPSNVGAYQVARSNDNSPSTTTWGNTTGISSGLSRGARSAELRISFRLKGQFGPLGHVKLPGCRPERGFGETSVGAIVCIVSLSGQSSCPRGVNFFEMWRVQRLDHLSAK